MTEALDGADWAVSEARIFETAIHEAGHAVVAELLCMNPEYVTIEPTEAFLGHLRRRGRGWGPIEKWRDLLVLCAGHVAEGLSPKDIDLEWFDPVEALMWLPPDDEISDGALLWASLREHSEDEVLRGQWFDLAVYQTRRILSNRAVWRSVESLVGRLMEKRTVDYTEAYEVIEVALWNSKWNRERFQMSERYAMPPQTWIDSREEYRAIGMALAARKGARNK